MSNQATNTPSLHHDSEALIRTHHNSELITTHQTLRTTHQSRTRIKSPPHNTYKRHQDSPNPNHDSPSPHHDSPSPHHDSTSLQHNSSSPQQFLQALNTSHQSLIMIHKTLKTAIPKPQHITLNSYHDSPFTQRVLPSLHNDSRIPQHISSIRH